MWTAAQNDQIRATELKIINQPTAAPIGGSCASSVDIVATKRDSGDLYSGRLGLLCGKYDSGSSAA